jgi:hypothetical protein
VSAGGSAGASGSGGAGGAGGSGDYFVSVFEDGVPIRAETDVRAYWYEGLQPGWLLVEAFTEDHAFYLLVLNALSSKACSYMVSAAVPRTPQTERGSFVEGGSCNVTVTATAPEVGDVFEGTFSAVVGAFVGAPLVTLTEGRFRAPRIPDGSPYLEP